MRVAVISDIHSNLHALDAVLADIDGNDVTELWCLGDVVGYGPRPNECCDLVRSRAAHSLCGNHDLAVLGVLDVGEFAGDAGRAARWTATEIGTEQRTWLETLRPSGRVDGAELFHGSPRDPVWEYVLSEQVALVSLQLTAAPLVLVGHSHVALALVAEDGFVEGGLAPADTVAELGSRRWLVNPGSVGQPRDGDPRAAWLLLDLDDRLATFRRVAYDVEQTQAEIRARGLPEGLASRLSHGV
jgi:diadenosine tetraphosphatase ApaH/serine/threonine PP2A family protein phosphatase